MHTHAQLPPLRVFTLAACCVLLVSGYAAGHPAPQVGSIQFGAAEKVADSVIFGLPIDVVGCPDGALIIADMLDNTLTKLSTDGAVIWRAGRGGQGPGEFQRLYRVACGPDGSVAAYDMTNQEISRFTASGEYIDRGRLDTRMEFVDRMVLLPSSRIAVAGISGGAHAVHVFDAESRRIASFGPLPPSQNPRALEYWGAGGLNVTADGKLLFTRRVPYEIYVFSETGEELDMIEAPYEMTRGPDDNYVETRTATGYKISANPEFVPRPLPAHDLGDGWLLSGRLNGPDVALWDLFCNGELVESFSSPSPWFFVAAVDRARRLLYVQSEAEDGNVEFLRVPYQLLSTNPGGQ